jgi:hypothetical protein
MNITDYKKKYLKYKAKYLNIKGGTPQSKPKMDIGKAKAAEPKMNIDKAKAAEPKMDIGKAKAAVRNINFLITAFLPKDMDGEFNMTNRFSESQDKVVYEDIVTPHTFEYYRINSFSYERSGNGINNSVTNKQNYNTLVDGLTSFGFKVKELEDYNTCMQGNCTPSLAKEYMNKLMYINAIYILSILNYDYIYNLYKWLIKNDRIKKTKDEITYTNYCTYILNSIFALKLAIYYLIINGRNANDTYDTSIFSELGINENELIRLINNVAINDAKCNKLFLYINKDILDNYTTQIEKIQIKLLECGKLKTNCETQMGLGSPPHNKLTNSVILDDMLPFIYSLIQQIYEDNQDIYNFDKIEKYKDINNSSTTGYNFDSFSFKGTLPPPIVIYRSLYENPNRWPYYAEINDAFTDPEKEPIIEQKKHSIKHSIEQKTHSIEQKKYSIPQKYPFSIIKELQDKNIQIENKYIPIGCKQDGTIAYAYVSLINNLYDNKNHK